MKRAWFVVAMAVSVLAGIAPAGRTDTGVFSIVRVPVASRAEAARLLGAFDDTHNYVPGHVELLAWPGDRARLEALGYEYTVVIEDLVAHDAALASPPGPPIALPGPDRSDYRHLVDYVDEMKALAKDHPDLVRLLKLPSKTLEGRTVYGVEIGAGDIDDGRPTYHVDGIHHAREWPAGEYPMIFAHYLVEGFGNDAEITKLLKKIRVTIVPVVNPDGFSYSRESLVQVPPEPGELAPLPLIALGAESYWRKNRRSFTGVTVPELQRNPDAYGVDPNRNYAFKWGDDIGGSASEPFDQTYRGSAPFSEPETMNVRDLIRSRNVVGLVSNHTSGRLVLRPWGDTAANPIDELLLASLGDEMAKAMGGYRNIKSIQLYATTGTTSDYAYGSLGALSYTFEHENAFHPAYANGPGANHDEVIEAFMILARATVKPRLHAVVEGRVVDAAGKPVEATLEIEKLFKTPLWPGNPTGQPAMPEKVRFKMATGPDGVFEWHLSPSTRPKVAEAGGTESYVLTISARRLPQKELTIEVARGEVLRLGTIRL